MNFSMFANIRQVKVYPEVSYFDRFKERNNSDYISSDEDDCEKKDEKMDEIRSEMEINSDLYEISDESTLDSPFKFVMTDSGKCLRQYTLASPKDHWNLKHGRCPDYAIDWGYDMNCKHWPPGHDFINGFSGSIPRDEFNEDEYQREEAEKWREVSKLLNE